MTFNLTEKLFYPSHLDNACGHGCVQCQEMWLNGWVKFELTQSVELSLSWLVGLSQFLVASMGADILWENHIKALYLFVETTVNSNVEKCDPLHIDGLVNRIKTIDSSISEIPDLVENCLSALKKQITLKFTKHSHIQCHFEYMSVQKLYDYCMQ